MRLGPLLLALSLLACKPGEGEPCADGACAADLACHEGRCVDPASYCRTDPARAERCKRDGLCTLWEGSCIASTQEDCDASQRCKEHGHCKLGGGCCSRDGVCLSEEEDPLTHLARLGSAEKRAAALDKLDLLYRSARARDEGAPGKQARALGELIAKPLAALALDPKVPEGERSKALALAAATHHPDALPALVRAVEKRELPRALPDVLAALTVMKPEAARAPVLALFEKLEASTDPRLAHALANAVPALAVDGWSKRLVARLERPVDPEGDAKVWQNERHWQRTAARALGRLRSEEAIAPLLRTVLSPFEEDIAPAAIEALVQIGKPAAEVAAAVLAGEHDELVAYAKAEHRRAAEAELALALDDAEAHRTAAAATVLARIGRRDAIEPVLDALQSAGDIAKARIALELVHLPHTPEVLAAFRRAYEESPLDVPITRTHSGIDALAEVAPLYFDASLVPWLIDRALGWKGTDTDLAPFRDAALRAALALMKPEHEEKVAELGATVTASKYRSQKDAALALMQACSSLACALAAATKAASQEQERVVQAAFLAGRLAVAGDEKTLAKGVAAARLPRARAVLAAALVHLLPEGDATLAADLQKSLELRGAYDDPALVEAVGRLRARAR